MKRIDAVAAAVLKKTWIARKALRRQPKGSASQGKGGPMMGEDIIGPSAPRALGGRRRSGE